MMEVPILLRIVFHFVQVLDMLMLDYNRVNNVFVETLMVLKDKILAVVAVCHALEIVRKHVEMDGETPFIALELLFLKQFQLLKLIHHPHRHLV